MRAVAQAGVSGRGDQVGGGRAVPLETRRQRVDAETARLAGLGVEAFLGFPAEEGLDHYGVAMKDPEGNEFDIA